MSSGQRLNEFVDASNADKFEWDPMIYDILRSKWYERIGDPDGHADVLKWRLEYLLNTNKDPHVIRVYRIVQALVNQITHEQKQFLSVAKLIRDIQEKTSEIQTIKLLVEIDKTLSSTPKTESVSKVWVKNNFTK